MAGMGPTIRARRLGQRLRALREASDLTPEETARRLGWSRSKLVRFERAREVPGPAATAALCELYGAPDTPLLMQLARDAKTRGWWTPYADVFQGSYVADEDIAETIRTFQAALIPGLLQTEEYARAIIAIGSAAGNPEEIQRRVRLRMSRRVLLTRTDPPPPHLAAIFDESVLHRHVGNPAVMADQMRYLTRARPNVTIRILPNAAGATLGLEGRFTILGFPDDLGFDPAVYVESIAGDIYPESVPLTRRVSVAYEQVSSAALTPGESAVMIREACDQYERKAKP